MSGTSGMSDKKLIDTRRMAAPQTNPETEPFFAAAREGRFVVRACRACGRVHWYPRAVCPFCASGDTEWRDAAGFGTIYSFSPMRQASDPYVVAYVTLDEGPSMLTNIVNADPDALAIGQRVAVRFHATAGNGPPMPVFEPAGP